MEEGDPMNPKNLLKSPNVASIFLQTGLCLKLVNVSLEVRLESVLLGSVMAVLLSLLLVRSQ